MPQPQVMPAHQAIPALALEWPHNPIVTAEKFRQFIEYHEAMNHTVTSCLYRCALVQLQRGLDVNHLHGCGLTDKQLKKEAGV